jgi:hypothetical protein
MVRKKELSPELVAEARCLYEQTLTPVKDIIAMVGLARSNFYYRIRDWGWHQRRRRGRNGSFELVHALTTSEVMRLPPMETAVEDVAPVSPQQRYVLALRIHEAAERQIAAVEKVLDALAPGKTDEAERRARTLACISRTLQDLAALNQPDEVTPPDEADDDPVPSDIDELRNELARQPPGYLCASLWLADLRAVGRVSVFSLNQLPNTEPVSASFFCLA